LRTAEGVEQSCVKQRASTVRIACLLFGKTS
jgi:hypothetical protein